jgi:hypothetical protein
MSTAIALAREYAAQRELWRPLVHHDPARRTSALLRDDDEATAWVTSWMDGHDTGWHDHGASSGAVIVLRGHVVEERRRAGRRPWFHLAGPGESFTFGPAIVHRIRHRGGPPAVTVHVSTPALARDLIAGAIELGAAA